MMTIDDRVGRTRGPWSCAVADPLPYGRPYGTLASSMNHFTDKSGYNAIGSQPGWCFRALKPPADHPVGAYFTTLTPQTPNLAVRLRIPREKLNFMFQFSDSGDLLPLEGGRGAYIYYSPSDYVVVESRQQFKGETGL